jgi:hypothetical protein
VKCLTPNLARNWVNFVEMKVGPLSVMICNGMPNLEKILDSRKETTFSSCVCKRDNLGPLIKVINGHQNKDMPYKRWRVDRTNKSMPHLEKGKSGRTGCKGMP